MLKETLSFLAISFFALCPSIVNASCDGYSVDYINDNGGYDHIACYNSFDSAKSKMKENPDYVVRHEKSLSPSKIMAMNSGVAYSYPARNNSSTLTIYQHVTDRRSVWKNTYIASHYEMEYKDTALVVKPGFGMIKVNINGFEGYADLEFTDLVPDKILKNHLPIELGGASVSENSFTVRPYRNVYEVKQNGNYKDLTFTYSLGYPDKNGNALRYEIYLGPAFDFLEEGKQYTSSDGINFYLDGKHVGKGYNYYQFLPFRTKSKISSDVLNKYVADRSNSVMKNKGDVFIEAQEKYGVNALALYAMAAHESAWGTSRIALNKNNLFGWNAVDSSPGESASSFKTVDQCILEQASINLRGYLDITDWRFFGMHVGNKGSGFNVKYASDPYWGQKIASIMYRVDKASRNFDGTLTDYNQVKLALIHKWDAPAYKNGKLIFTASYGPNYQQDFIIPVVDGLVQSPNILVDGNLYKQWDKNGDLNPKREYDFNYSLAEMKSEYLTPLNFTLTTTKKDGLTYVSKMDLNDNGLLVEGYSIIPGVVFNKAEHKVLLKEYNGNITEFTANTINEDFQNGDGTVYKNSKFSVTIPYDKLKDGILMVKTTSDKLFSEEVLKNTNPKFSRNTNGKYTVFTNQINNYRFEVSVNSDNLFNDINKPAVRNSLLSFDKIEKNENKIKIVGQGAIYYTDYSSEKDVALILSNGQNNYRFENKSLKCPINYKPILGTKENLDYICFDLEADITNLPSGEYSIFVELTNGEHKDIVELTNRSGRDIPLKTSEIRKKVMVVK